jgi:hypothetical protein
MAASKSRAGQSTEPRENVIQARIRVALGMEPDLYLMRNHVGGSEEYNPTRDEVRHQRFGLAKGSADLVGILLIPVILERSGRAAWFGRWFCLEVKKDSGVSSPDQLQWQALARKFGAFVAVVRSPEEAKAALVRARHGESE